MRANVYIRKENEVFWDTLSDKSLQVNHWIAVAKNGDSAFKEPAVINVGADITPEGISRLATSSARKVSNGYCKKHGTKLDSNGKCLQKGH